MRAAFDKIAAGLADAIAYAERDATRGELAARRAEDEADIDAARRAFADGDVRYSGEDVRRMIAGETPWLD